jgi:hypothetical protein
VSRTRCGILHAAPQSRDLNERRCLVRSRFSEAALKKRCIAPGTRDWRSSLPGFDPAIHPLRKSLRRVMDTRAFASPKGLRPRRRVEPAYDAEYVPASCEFPNSNFKQPRPRVLAAQSVRGLPVPREPCEGMERWEAPGHQWAPLRRVVNPPRAARQPRAPKARRSASQRST